MVPEAGRRKELVAGPLGRWAGWREWPRGSAKGVGSGEWGGDLRATPPSHPWDYRAGEDLGGVGACGGHSWSPPPSSLVFPERVRMCKGLLWAAGPLAQEQSEPCEACDYC